MRSITPLSPIVDRDCTVLILGSHPSVISKEVGFYYGNPHNRFWKVMGSLLDVGDMTDLSPEDKTRLLLCRHVALYDVVEGCDLVGSQDASIKNVAPADIRGLLAASRIERIFLNGATAYKLFARHFPDLVSIATPLPSTSPANAKMRLDDLLSEWEVVRQSLEK